VDRRHHRRAADACPELAIPRFINRHIVSLGIGSLFLLLIGVWGQFFLIAPDKSSIPATTSIQRSIFVIAGLVFASMVIRESESLEWPLVTTAMAILVLVGAFAGLYSSSGSRANWTQQLTRLDALQLSLGTLTTAGAPGITPRSELARALMTTQLFVDIFAAIVLFGLLVARLAERPRIPNKASAHLELERPLPSPDEPTRHEKHRLTTAIVLFGLLVSERRAGTHHRQGSPPQAGSQDL
jgi:hypothetical protein